MPDAELSSLVSMLTDVRNRITASAEAAQKADSDRAVDLFEVERSLAMAIRRLVKLVDA